MAIHKRAPSVIQKASVPVVPTEEMVLAGLVAANADQLRPMTVRRFDVAEIWKAMIAAAPQKETD